MWMTSGEVDGEEESTLRGMPILVAADQASGWVGAWRVPRKGDHWYSTQVLAKQIEEWGYDRIILRSDQEPAIKALKAAVKRESQCEIVFVKSLQ